MDSPSSPEAHTGISRRDFLRGGTTAVVGSVVAGAFPAKASAFYASDDAIRVGLIGCGGRGTGAALQALSCGQNVRLVAMADAFQDRLDESLANLQNPEYGDWSGTTASSVQARIDVPVERRFVGFDGYKQVIPLVDVVILATPPGFRPMHFEAAIDAGKHVFMEKPVATDAPGVRQVLATHAKAVEKKLNVVVGLQRHYEAKYREWIDRIHDGAIGDVVLGRVYWNSEGVWVRPRQPQWNEMEYQMRNWYYFTWLCGDHIVEQHIHNIDVGNWVKQGPPVRAQGQGGRLVRTGPDTGQIYDHHFVEFEYADGSRVLSQCRHMPGCMNRVSEAFHGTRGSAPEPGVLLDAEGQTIYTYRDKEAPNPYQVEHDELFAAVAAGDYQYADAALGAEATMTAILGRMATYSGTVVEWDAALASEESLMPERFAWDAVPPVLPGPDGGYPVPMPGTMRA
ncbi:MAG: Gfo/Idh/MocA family oxidoreductase [Rhodothermales bacterium]|nr:Gfo/Idh/MocA family oxidoreductase [Rhodothermales bacterium]